MEPLTFVVLCVVVIYIERENWRTLLCWFIVCVRERGGLEEPFVVLGTVILCERGRELEVSCVVLV